MNQPTLMDNYDYVMHGKVFSVKHIENQRVEVQGMKYRTNNLIQTILN